MPQGQGKCSENTVSAFTEIMPRSDVSINAAVLEALLYVCTVVWSLQAKSIYSRKRCGRWVMLFSIYNCAARNLVWNLESSFFLKKKVCAWCAKTSPQSYQMRLRAFCGSSLDRCRRHRLLIFWYFRKLLCKTTLQKLALKLRSKTEDYESIYKRVSKARVDY